MRGDGDGANPPQAGDAWGMSTRPPSYDGPPQPGASAPGSPYGKPPTQGYPRPVSGSPQWQHPSLDAPATQWPAAAPVPVGGSVRQRNLPTFLRPPAVWFTGIAAAGIVFILVMLLAAPPAPTPRGVGAIGTATWTPMPIPTAVPTATATPLPVFSLPAFSDWRAAYLAADGKLHVTSLDGQTDLAGPALSLNTANTTNSTVTPGFADTYQTYTSMSISPNGQYLAFIAQAPQPSGAGIAPPAGDLIIVSLTGNAAWSPRLIPGPVTSIGGWSPDSQTLAYRLSTPFGAVGAAAPGGQTLAYAAPQSSAAAGIYTVTLPNGPLLQVPAPATVGTVSTEDAVTTAHVLGWIDATHLALVVSTQSFAFPPLPGEATATPSGMLAPPVAQTGPAASGRSMLAAPLMRPSSSYGAVSLATVNITTGVAYTIAPLQQGAMVALSPDGTQVVAENSCVGVCAGMPLVTEVISTATGATHALPNSDAAIAPTVGFVWNPQADTFAATVNINPHATGAYQWQVSLVDAQHDAAQTVRTGAFALGWSPDGQALAVADASGLGKGPAKVWLVAPGSGNAPVALPQPVVAFIGFVRTSGG